MELFGHRVVGEGGAEGLGDGGELREIDRADGRRGLMGVLHGGEGVERGDGQGEGEGQSRKSALMRLGSRAAASRGAEMPGGGGGQRQAGAGERPFAA